MANTKKDVFLKYDMTKPPDECWQWSGVWGGRDRDKRPYITCDGVRYIAYRLVYSLVTGMDLQKDQMVLHSCDNGGWPTGCGNPRHLSIGDNRTNVDDRVIRQRHGLSHSVVRNIRRLRSQGKTQSEVAELYGISREAVSAIDTGRLYSHVKDESNAEGNDSTDAT